MTHAISSGVACFADAGVEEMVSARQEQGVSVTDGTNIGLPISRKSWSGRGGRGLVERRRIRCPVGVLVSC